MAIKEVRLKRSLKGWLGSLLPDTSISDKFPKPISKQRGALRETLQRLNCSSPLRQTGQKVDVISGKPRKEMSGSDIRSVKDSAVEGNSVPCECNVNNTGCSKCLGSISHMMPPIFEQVGIEIGIDGESEMREEYTVEEKPNCSIEADVEETRSSSDSSESTIQADLAPDRCPTMSCMRVRTLEESLECRDTSDSKSAFRDNFSGKSVQFDQIEIREYAQCVGDNPCCSSGPPISLDWMPESCNGPFQVDYYENHRYPRRILEDMRISEQSRVENLLDLGYSCEDLMQAEVKLLKDQLLRERTLGMKHSHIEEAFENVRRKYIRLSMEPKKTNNLNGLSSKE
eukprot:CAMPEP_0183314678 /NCGR_PEP_ID=MMETSP0160_2-20130417/49245_1 /TAXON_ID=2839 ORGANISM="Odontella Sinensis, Strain Grunow 1884" /NCGR_SAMPLE_ID=MMETSP0160_2 /ASSEMBLY_ACC=CAM_ASM_000250 /LENGTH=341 /DNA_ID=CAMNT_0025480069 /DNA_START=261 /DNA_END=1283 /DNA_ORIENTATION=+